MRQPGNLQRPWSSTSVLLKALAVLQWAVLLAGGGEATCVPATGWCTAYAFYTVQNGDNLEAIGSLFQITEDQIQAVNPNITDVNFILTGIQIYIPFECDCINDQRLHLFLYQVCSLNSLEALDV